MDSKLRKLTILGSVAVILMVSVLVLYANSGKTGEHKQGSGSQGVPSQENSLQQDASKGSGGQLGNDLTAFLKDSSFFDPEINPLLEAAKNQANRLSLMVTSIEKDLRIQIVNGEGMPVTGESFFVKLDGLGEYKDLDKDGIIYIGDLSAGEYFLQLQPLEGYRVPINETKVRVKDKVEYLAIEDISLLIKTEDEVDAKAEDTRQKDALSDADRSEMQSLRPATGNAHVGIDVSKWNGDIDWDKVKAEGVEFAIIRAGYRGSVTGSIVQDPKFEENMRGATAAGIQVGAYFFTQAVNEVEAVEEASAVLRLVREYSLDYPIFIDTEGAGGSGRADGLDKETRTLVCEAFCRTVSNAGIRGGVYASRNWYNNNLDMKRLDAYYIWLAEYRSTPLYQGYYQMWQHSSKGRVDGIKGNVDLDIAYH